MTQYGLLPPQSGYGLLGYDEKQARLDAFLNGLGNTSAALLAAGAPSTDPGNFGRNMAKIGPGFAQGFQGSMQNSRNRAFQDMQANMEQQKFAMQQKKQKDEEAQRLARERLANVGVFNGTDMAGQPVDTEALYAKGYPDLYGKAVAAKMFPGASGEEWGKNPIWGTDKNGNPVIGVVSNRGNFKAVDTNGINVQRGQTGKMDLGNQWAILDANGSIIAYQPKGIGPQRFNENGQVVTVPAVAPGELPQSGTQPPGVQQAGGMPEPEAAGISAVPIPKTPKQKEEELQVATAQSRKISSQLDRLEGLRKTVGDLKEKAKSWFTGGLTGQLAQASAGSEQYAMNVKTREIQSIIGLDNLVSIKEQGGTFGALSEKELDLLIAKAGSLDPLLESFPDDLDQVMTLYEKGLAGQIEDFYAVNKNARPDWAKRPIVKTLGVRVEKPAENSIQEVRGDGNMQDENQKAIDAWKLNNPFPTD